MVLVPPDRLLALLPQRSVRENVAAPRYNSPLRWGPINLRDETRKVRDAVDALQIDMRAGRQVRRLSGGNQQKVTIARWLASGFTVLLCNDPTRGIDIGTKRQVYGLLRDLAENGAAILFFSSELSELPFVSDRVLTLYAGRVTAELPGGRGRGDAAPGHARARPRRRGRVTRHHRGHAARVPRRPGLAEEPRLHGWTVGVWLVLLAMVPYWRSLSQQSFEFDIQALAIDALPLCFAAMAQAVVVISGGIDLSVGSLMGLMNVLSAKHMIGISFRDALLFSLVILLLVGARGRVHRARHHRSRASRTSSSRSACCSSGTASGSGSWRSRAAACPQQFYDLGLGSSGRPRSRRGGDRLRRLRCPLAADPLAPPGLSIYAVGSNRNAAYLSGIGVARTRVGAYMLGGVFAGLAGLALTATSGIGDPNSGSIYTLNSVAAVVLGGVSLLGGVGGLIGPIAAAYILTLSKTILLIRGTDPNYAAVYQGLADHLRRRPRRAAEQEDAHR